MSKVMTHRNLDDVLDELGQFGRYQLRLYCFILIAIVLNAVYNAQYVFVAADLPYRCMVPECESTPVEWTPGEWGSWTLAPERCERYEPLKDSCERDAFHPNTTIHCNAFVYKTNNTIVAEFELGCHDWKRTLVGTIHSLGVFTALTFIGIVSDTIGRRITFILTATSCAVTGLARSFAPNYTLFVIIEYFEAVFGAGVYSTGYILAMEMVGRNRRVIYSCTISSTFALGQVLLAMMAWAIPYWRTLIRVLYTPSFLFVFYFFILQESVRWLFSKNRPDEAVQILRRVAAINRRHISEETLQRLCEAAAESKSHQAARSSVPRQVLRSRILITRVAVCSFCWITITFVYYGLSINSVSLGNNMYVSYSLTALVEIPGYICSALLLDRFGRKRTIMTALVICSLTLITLPFLSAVWQAQLALTLIGKMSVSTAFNAIYVLTLELFPTVVRHRALGFCAMVSRLGQAAAMLTPLLMSIATWLPYVSFGVLSLLAALLLNLVPDTSRSCLPDTVSQAENLHRQKSFPTSQPTPTGATKEAPPLAPKDASTLAPEAAPIMLSKSASTAVPKDASTLSPEQPPSMASKSASTAASKDGSSSTTEANNNPQRPQPAPNTRQDAPPRR